MSNRLRAEAITFVVGGGAGRVVRGTVCPGPGGFRIPSCLRRELQVVQSGFRGQDQRYEMSR